MGECFDREKRVKPDPHRRPTNHGIDLQASAEVREDIERFTRLVDFTGGPAAPCTIVLPHGTGIKWGGMSLCDAAAFAWLHGPGLGSVEPSEELAEQAAAFGLAYVRARKALTEPKDTQGASDPGEGSPAA